MAQGSDVTNAISTWNPGTNNKAEEKITKTVEELRDNNNKENGNDQATTETYELTDLETSDLLEFDETSDNTDSNETSNITHSNETLGSSLIQRRLHKTLTNFK